VRKQSLMRGPSNTVRGLHRARGRRGLGQTTRGVGRRHCVTGSARGGPALPRVAVQSATERTTAPPRLTRGLKGLRLFCH
jgi:hypothetical protein